MESLLVWGLALVAATLVLVVIELFVPSAGLVGALAAICGIAGVVCLSMHDWRWGLGSGLMLIVLVPLMVVFGLQIMPSTPIGRKLVHGESGEPTTALDPDAPNAYAEMVGKEADVVTDLRPVGQIRIGGVKYDAMSEIAFVRAGTKVRVTSVKDQQIRVRPV